jgi:hypothetical protein
MRSWPKGPLIYEINTWVWLRELSRQATHPITLASVSEAEWDRIARLGFDVVWLMGVWERSPEGMRISMANEGLLADFRRALPDFEAQDNVGSPYCVRRYAVDAHLGGSTALAVARSQLAERGVRLILDFVPNQSRRIIPGSMRTPTISCEAPRQTWNAIPMPSWPLTAVFLPAVATLIFPLGATSCS